MRDGCPITRNILRRQDLVLRTAATRGLSLAELAVAAEVSADTLESYLERRSRPPALMSLAKFVKIAGALVKAGHADLASLLIEDSGCRLSLNDAEATSLYAVGAAAAGLAQQVCVAGGDGRFDHREKAAIKRSAGPLLAMLLEVTAEGGAHEGA